MVAFAFFTLVVATAPAGLQPEPPPPAPASTSADADTGPPIADAPPDEPLAEPTAGDRGPTDDATDLSASDPASNGSPDPAAPAPPPDSAAAVTAAPPAVDVGAGSGRRKGLRRHRFVYKNLTAARINPLGLINEFSLGYRLQLIDRNTALFKESYFALKAHTFLTPAYGRIGPMIELQPLALINLQAIYNVIGYFKTFDQLQSFQSPNARYSDSDLEDRTAARYPGTGHLVTLAAMLQAKAGRVALRNNLRFYYASLDLARDPVTKRSDTVYYDQTLDILQPNNGWTLSNDADVLYLFDFGLKLAARYTLTHAFYRDEMFLAGESKTNRNAPTHRVGPAVLYSPPKWSAKAAKRSGKSRKRWQNPTVILLVQWWAKHRWRTGQDVSAGLPYLALAFSFEGDFFP